MGGARIERVWYAASTDGSMFSSVVVPLETQQGGCGGCFGGPGFSVPSTDNTIPGQRNQGLWLSLFVPLTVKPGAYSAQLVFSVSSSGSGAQELAVALSLTVVTVSLPEAVTFALDLNR